MAKKQTLLLRKEDQSLWYLSSRTWSCLSWSFTLSHAVHSFQILDLLSSLFSSSLCFSAFLSSSLIRPVVFYPVFFSLSLSLSPVSLIPGLSWVGCLFDSFELKHSWTSLELGRPVNDHNLKQIGIFMIAFSFIIVASWQKHQYREPPSYVFIACFLIGSERKAIRVPPAQQNHFLFKPIATN